MSKLSPALFPLALAAGCCVSSLVSIDRAVSHPAESPAPNHQMPNPRMPNSSDAEASLHQSQHHSPHHKAIEIPDGQPVPTVTIAVIPDPMKGWNVQVQTQNFAFSANPLKQDAPVTEGHAHLFLNGKKLTRMYGHWYYLEALPKGRNELRVTLNTNQHADLLHKGKPIAAQTIVVVP